MIARFAPSFPQLAAALFPIAKCTVRGYSFAHGTRYNIELMPPQPWAGPASYHGTGTTCYEALAQAVQVFHASAHAYPAAGPLAAAGSYSPPQEPQPFPSDDEPATLAGTASADEQPATVTCPKCNGAGCQHDVPPGQPVHGGDIYECYHCEGTGQVPATLDDTADADEQKAEQEHDPNACEHCGGSGQGSRPNPYDGDPGCVACGGSGKRRLGYWNNYGRDMDGDHDD